MRLVTRADFDGLACGALITKFENIDSYLFVEPKFMQDGMVEIHGGDIIANLPYHPNCTLWFDHHITNTTPDFPRPIMPGRGAFRLAPSAARVVCEYYTEIGTRREAADIHSRERAPFEPAKGGPSIDTQHGQQESSHEHVGSRPFPTDEILPFLNSARMKLLLHETDRIDAGRLTPQDVLNPQGYVLVSMTTDGRYVEDEPYWLKVIELLRDSSLEEVMRDPEVLRRCRQILDQQEKLKAILLERTRMQGNVIFVDFRGIKDIPDGNRFLLYTLFPKGNISVKVAEDIQRENTTAISVGYNIFNPTSNVNVGALLQKYGGGGHRVVGSCRVPNDKAEQAIREIVTAVRDA
jgi:hypothetical protein